MADKRKPLLDGKAHKNIAARKLREDQYRGNGRESALTTFLWGPAGMRPTKISVTIRGCIMELIGVMLFALVTNMAVSLSAASANTLLSGVLVGVLAGGSYFMACSWIRTHGEDYELPRHLSWTVSLGHALVFRLGFIYLLIYLVVQTLGALLAGLVLLYFGNGVVPASLTTAPYVFDLSISYMLEIMGAMFIVFAILYNNYLSHSDAAEDRHVQHGQYAGSLVRGIWTSVFYSKAAYSFDAVIIIAGCSFTSALSDAGNGWGFYVGVPLIGTACAVLLYLITLVILDWGHQFPSRMGRKLETHVQSD